MQIFKVSSIFMVTYLVIYAIKSKMEKKLIVPRSERFGLRHIFIPPQDRVWFIWNLMSFTSEKRKNWEFKEL